MTRKHRNLFNLFQQNTGKTVWEMKPYVPPGKNLLTGHQVSRVTQFWGRRKGE